MSQVPEHTQTELKLAARRFIKGAAEIAAAKELMARNLRDVGCEHSTVITTEDHGAVLCTRKGTEWNFEAVGVVGG